MKLRSPASGHVLRRERHALVAGDERWPVVDEIAFLRTDRRALADEALAHLDDGDDEAALVLLLGDQDDWAPTPPPTEEARRTVVRRRDALNFREAMELLAFGPVGIYFAHRWSDPTFLSGLALAQAHWSAPARVLEVACGAGHFLRAFAPHATDVVGGDLVFAKLWLARHFIAPHAMLVCFDASGPFPFENAAADLLFCHDAFYFLPRKPAAAAEMMRVSPHVLVGHMHNALVENLSAGEPLSPAAYAALFPGCRLFDDAELTNALVAARAPCVVGPAKLTGAAAIALQWGDGTAGRADGPLTRPEYGTALRRNPLYRDDNIFWPSERYEREYSALATYPRRVDAPATARMDGTPAIADMVRRRVLLDLPERW